MFLYFEGEVSPSLQPAYLGATVKYSRRELSGIVRDSVERDTCYPLMWPPMQNEKCRVQISN